MTLHELMNLVPEAKWVVRVPSIKMLLNEAQVVLREGGQVDENVDHCIQLTAT